MTIFSLNEDGRGRHPGRGGNAHQSVGNRRRARKPRLASLGAALLLERSTAMMKSPPRPGPCPGDARPRSARRTACSNGRGAPLKSTGASGPPGVEAVGLRPAAGKPADHSRRPSRRGVATPAHQGPPGTVTSLSKEGITVACGGGTRYLITRLHPESRAEMDAHAFVLGGGIQAGDLLE